MKTISLWQPWASLVVHEIKRVETRGWRAPRELIGQRIGIAATAREPKNVAGLCRDEPFRSALAACGVTRLAELPRGAVLGTAVLVDCVPTANVRFGADIATHREHGFGPLLLTITDDEAAFGDYGFLRYAWPLAEVERFEVPVPCPGRQKFWDWEPAEARA